MNNKVLKNRRNVHNYNVKIVQNNVNCLWAVCYRYWSRQCRIKEFANLTVLIGSCWNILGFLSSSVMN